MAKPGFQHTEAFLQWIWENLLFNFTELKSNSGSVLTILNPGMRNVSDGPDFNHAVIEIDDITWHGDVEIHTRSTYWSAHSHHTDPNFNKVILHVVADHEATQVVTSNGSKPETLNLLPYLSPEVYSFFQYFSEPKPGLPCSASLHYISEEAFKKQIEKAHLEYFEKKTNDCLSFYGPNLLPSLAWKKALILSLWDGLGISHNREAMVQTATALLGKWDGEELNKGIDQAMNIAGLGGTPSEINWNYKSVRPASHPKKRIRQAVKFSQTILKLPFHDFLRMEPTQLWALLLRESSLKKTPHLEILFGTVLLPSLYLLGNLLASSSRSESALSAWKHLKTPIPRSILDNFHSFDLEETEYLQKLGSVHQIKSYCKAGRCSECFVLKKAIQS